MYTTDLIKVSPQEIQEMIFALKLRQEFNDACVRWLIESEHGEIWLYSRGWAPLKTPFLHTSLCTWSNSFSTELYVERLKGSLKSSNIYYRLVLSGKYISSKRTKSEFGVNYND